MQLILHSPQVWQITGFLSPKACEDLILFSEMRGYQEAALSLESDPLMMKNIRNNYRLVYEDKHLAATYWERLKVYCPAEIEGQQAIGLYEHFRFYKYEKAQRFKRHIDGRQKRENEESRITFMIYLNDDFAGGETAFDHVKIKPQTGHALCFIHELKHAGMPIIEGTKYVLRTDVMYQKS